MKEGVNEFSEGVGKKGVGREWGKKWWGGWVRGD